MATQVQICNLALSRIGIRGKDLISSLKDATTTAQSCAAIFPVSLDTITTEFWWPFATRRATLALVGAPYPAWNSGTTYAQNQQVTVQGTPGYFVSLSSGNLNNQPTTTGNGFWQYFSVYTRTGWNYMYQLPADCVEVQDFQFQPDLGMNGAVPFNQPIPQPQFMRSNVPNTEWARPEFAVEADDANDGSSVILTNMVISELKYTGSLQAIAKFPAAFSEAFSWLLARDLAMALPNKRDYAEMAQKGYTATLKWAIARSINTSSRLHEPPSEFELAR